MLRCTTGEIFVARVPTWVDVRFLDVMTAFLQVGSDLQSKVTFGSVFDAFAAMPTANPLNEIPLEAYDPSRASVQLSDTPFGAQQFNMTMNCPGMETIQRGYVICNSSTQIMPSKGNLIILQ